MGSRILAGATAGATIGSGFPIVGTIVGAVSGAFLAGVVEDFFFGEGWFEDGDKKRELQQQEEENKLYEIYITKINQIGDYLLRHKYIEKRILKYYESDELCRSINNPNESYFKTILLMQSFPNYLDRDREFYKSLQSQDTQKDSKERESSKVDSVVRESKKEIIKPIADSIKIKLEIQECYDSHTGNPLANTTIYNHRFQRVVAKGTTDSKAYLKIENVSVGQEIGIDKLSFIVDRDNLSESNFELSKTQYATITNIQAKHKKAKEYKASKLYLGFNEVQSKLKSNYEIIKLMAQMKNNTITLTPQINTTDTRYKQYTQFAYMVFDVMDFGIDEYIANISIQNRQSSGLNKLGNGLKTTYNIKKAWENKIVALFAYCDSQIHTPYVKTSFINKPIVILDIGDSGALATKYEQNSMIRKDIISNVIDRLSKNIKPMIYPIILGQNNESLEQRVKIANTIKHNIGHNRILFLSLHIDSEATQKASGMRCFYNAREHTKEEEAFIEILKNIKPDKNNENFIHKSNFYLTKFINMLSVLITLGFISNENDRIKLNQTEYKKSLAASIFLAINNYAKKYMK